MSELVKVTSYRGLVVFDIKGGTSVPYKLFIDPAGGGIWLNDPSTTLAISAEALRGLQEFAVQPESAVFGDIDWYMNAGGSAAVGWNLRAARVADEKGQFAAFENKTTRMCSRLVPGHHKVCDNETREEVRMAIDAALAQAEAACGHLIEG